MTSLREPSRDAVIAAESDRGAVTHGDPGDVSGRDGLLFVGQQVGRGATRDADDAIQPGEHTGGARSRNAITTQ